MHDDLLRPSEVARIFGVRPATVARWARDGRITPVLTPGGHRRYPCGQIQAVLLATEAEDASFAEDAARLYDQGWSIRQVAARFDTGYGVMRRILAKRVPLRNRAGRYPS